MDPSNRPIAPPKPMQIQIHKGKSDAVSVPDARGAPVSADEDLEVFAEPPFPDVI